MKKRIGILLMAFLLIFFSFICGRLLKKGGKEGKHKYYTGK
ncbi:hypothetical protein CLC_1403 [Clostridium botulinum A str. Hall]|nr:hypothetical protein CLC_1403 [Clostridium botulinum A str. Hall]